MKLSSKVLVAGVLAGMLGGVAAWNQPPTQEEPSTYSLNASALKIWEKCQIEAPLTQHPYLQLAVNDWAPLWNSIQEKVAFDDTLLCTNIQKSVISGPSAITDKNPVEEAPSAQYFDDLLKVKSSMVLGIAGVIKTSKEAQQIVHDTVPYSEMSSPSSM